MPEIADREIYIKASRSFDLVQKSIQLFTDYLTESCASTAPEYYKARNLLKESKSFFGDTLREAKKLLGPIPVYATAEFEQRKARILEENKIVTHGQDYGALRAELVGDDFLKAWMTEGEIDAHLQSRYETQRSGKRKLSNIKVRMILDKLSDLIRQTEELQKAAQKKQQGIS